MRKSTRRRKVAYVLPVFNEAEGIGAFHHELTAATDARTDLDFEFVYIDDGSRDRSLELLLELRAADPRVSVLQLSRNFGHQLAVTAGLDLVGAPEGAQDAEGRPGEASADAVIIMDTDLQDPPEVSMDMIRMWEDGVDVVYGQRRARRDTWFKRSSAYAYYWLLDRLTESRIPRNVGDFRLMDARVVTEVSRYREHGRYLRGIVAIVGFRQEALVFDRSQRHAGETGYPLRKMIKLAADGILSFSVAPLRWISRIGIMISLLSVAAAAYILFVRLFQPEAVVPGWAFLGVGMFLLGGVQLVVMGIIGTYLGRVYIETQDRPLYSLAAVARGGPPTPNDSA